MNNIIKKIRKIPPPLGVVLEIKKKRKEVIGPGGQCFRYGLRPWERPPSWHHPGTYSDHNSYPRPNYTGRVPILPTWSLRPGYPSVPNQFKDLEAEWSLLIAGFHSKGRQSDSLILLSHHPIGRIKAKEALELDSRASEGFEFKLFNMHLPQCK